MITIEEADRIIKKSLPAYKPVTIPLKDALQRILQEDIFADRNLPPFDKVLLDGIAIDRAAYQKGQRKFYIQGTQPAGYKALKLKSPQHAIEIMTGAVLPTGADTVVPIEQVQIIDNEAVIKDGLTLIKDQFISRTGNDHKQGARLLARGVKLFPPQIAVAAGVGAAKLKVSPLLKVAVVTSGDELVDIDRPVKIFQTRHLVEQNFDSQGF